MTNNTYWCEILYPDGRFFRGNIRPHTVVPVKNPDDEEVITFRIDGPLPRQFIIRAYDLGDMVQSMFLTTTYDIGESGSIDVELRRKLGSGENILSEV